MPTDGVKNRTFRELLNTPVRFEIPFFQRGYAWDRKQWDQLFLDIQEQIISDLSSGSEINDLEHFFGPIVVLEKTDSVPELKEFLVVDGQQRITTVYLLLAVIQEQLQTKKHLSTVAYDYVHKLKKFTSNDVDGNDDYMKLKVFSSKGDRLPTYRAVFGSEANPKTHLLNTDLQLYIPGRNRVDEFRKYATKKLAVEYGDIPSLWQLSQILLNCLKIVWIPLDHEKDDPQAIFESLNDKGTPLTASELICNHVFRPLIRAKENYEELHNDQWLASVRILETNERFEEYLRNQFSIGENKMVGKNRRVYVHFKMKNRQLTTASSKQHLSDIYSGAKLYRSIVDPLQNPYSDNAINEVLVSIQNTRMDSSTPFVLSVLRAIAAETVASMQACAILRETLVLLVRRKMTEQATTQYDVMFPPLLARIVNESNIIAALHEQFKKHNVWVSDQEFRSAFVNRQAYRTRDLAFSRMLLMELDKRLQVHGQLPDYSTLHTIEHMIPQTLDDGWKAYLGADATDEHLPQVVQTIGNLCLLSGPANSAAGQNPFESKRQGYSEVTALARAIRAHAGNWNISAIKARSEELAEHALSVWTWSTTQ